MSSPTQGIKLPNNEKVIQCTNHHLQDDDGKDLEQCLQCGMKTREFVKWGKLAQEASSTPDEFDDWMIEVFKRKLYCPEHRHIVLVDE